MKFLIQLRFLLFGVFFLISIFYSCDFSEEKTVYDLHLEYHQRMLSSNNLDYENQVDFWTPSPNFDLRKPLYIILHHTAQGSYSQTLDTFSSVNSRVSSHYLITKSGDTYQFLNDFLRGWHAGESKWGKITDLNSVSIGIELENTGFEEFPESQITSLVSLLSFLSNKYKIPSQNILGHSDISPGRKSDPSRLFPWETLADNGFGMWYGDIDDVNREEVGIKIPIMDFDIENSLRSIGYDTRSLPDAVSAFKLHFNPGDSSSEMGLMDKRILHNLYEKYK